MTPEGFLVCLDVPIGRVGTMMYGPGETPVQTGYDGVAYIDREEVELFSEATLTSFNGKPVTNDHPANGVDVNNWRSVAMGYVQNPRRGTGDMSDYMIADLVLTDSVIIEEVLNGKREVSSGYDNDYIQFEPGKGRQVNIIGNHVALVRSGRCGSRCAIQDNASKACQGGSMTITFKELKARASEAFKNRDESGLNNALNSMLTTQDDSGGVIHVDGDLGKYDEKCLDTSFNNLETRMKELEKTQDADIQTAVDASIKKYFDGADFKKTLNDAVSGAVANSSGADRTLTDKKEEKKEEDEETDDASVSDEEPKAKGSKDSLMLESNFNDTVALAEIISPGIHIPTFDKAAKPGDTVEVVCGLRRKSLQLASKDAETADLIKQARGGRVLSESEIKTMDCSPLRSLFFAVGALKKAANNKASAASGSVDLAAAAGTNKISIADVNKRNRERKW
jgi:hypothetical protein